MTSKKFKVAAVSSNTNEFGLRGHILIAKDGTAYEVAANNINSKDKGTILTVPTHKGNPDWTGFGFEIPRELPKCPKNVTAEVWK